MTETDIKVSIIMPALNEEDNIFNAVSGTLKSFKHYKINGEVVVVNDGSRDRTAEIVKELITAHPDGVRLIEHNSPKGVGASFWDGVANARGEIVCMLPGDNENDPSEILRYTGLLEHVDIVIPFLYNKWVRSAFRNILSFLYRTIINTTFGVNLNYTNGTVLYRKSILRSIKQKSSGFFFQTDILIRLLKKGYLFAEVPYQLGVRSTGTSKAVSFPSLLRVMKGYLRLVKDIHFSPKGKFNKKDIIADSLSAKRYNGDTQR